jgi:PDZ domain
MKRKLASPEIVLVLVLALVPFAATAKMSKAILSDADGIIIGGSSPGQTIKIEAIENGAAKKPAKEVAWLGISTDEACDVLASQLGLKSGEGLVVIYVEPNSPAAKAGLQKYDVLVGMGDQLLVHPLQLRKLVRRQNIGDSIKLEYYRAGKKQSATATLSKTMERTEVSEEMLHGLDPKIARALDGEINGMISHAGYKKPSANVDLQKSMEQARKALHEALARNANLTWVVGPGLTNLEALTLEGLNVGAGTTLTVKKNGNAAKSIAKADETGTYVIVADPKKRLTVHDNAGKLVFDGEIETEAEQQKVPADLWLKARTMLDELGPTKQDQAEPEARSTEQPNPETNSRPRG